MVIPQIIKIKRPSAWTHNSKNFTVFLDGRKMSGRIANGEELEIAVEPGSHELSLKMGLLGSNTVKFEINDNNPMIFEYNSYRKEVILELHNTLSIGKHSISIDISDNVGNHKIKSGDFYIIP